MAEETRRPGRRRSETKRRTISVTLSDDVAEALDQVTDNRSAFIEAALRERPDVQAALRTANEQIS